MGGWLLWGMALTPNPKALPHFAFIIPVVISPQQASNIAASAAAPLK
jgi:hypothetical protein